MTHPEGARLKEYEGRQGTIRQGTYQGLTVIVDEDPSRTGWHINIMGNGDGRVPPRTGAYDIWADTEADAWEWLEEFAVEWHGRTG